VWPEILVAALFFSAELKQRRIIQPQLSQSPAPKNWVVVSPQLHLEHRDFPKMANISETEVQNQKILKNPTSKSSPKIGSLWL